ncbi:flap endonuclease 1-like [Oppia nitens]|uniref:flap endonuclease 1-like n=1 Tax=Oppia nitens TaxID=1686743 RepID=UPI0023DBBB61|nr:flap endonuclease 1-like [Oppia nitens]
MGFSSVVSKSQTNTNRNTLIMILSIVLIVALTLLVVLLFVYCFCLKKKRKVANKTQTQSPINGKSEENVIQMVDIEKKVDIQTDDQKPENFSVIQKRMEDVFKKENKTPVDKPPNKGGQRIQMNVINFKKIVSTNPKKNKIEEKNKNEKKNKIENKKEVNPVMKKQTKIKHKSVVTTEIKKQKSIVTNEIKKVDSNEKVRQLLSKSTPKSNVNNNNDNNNDERVRQLLN